MSLVRRIYVETKEMYAVAGKALLGEIRPYLGIREAGRVRILARYDIEGVSEEVYEAAKHTVFAEPPVDLLYESFEELGLSDSDRVFSVAYLPGQYDQRADSAEQCLKLLKEDAAPLIRSATTYIIHGSISDEDFEEIRRYCINPVDSMEVGEEVPATLALAYEEPEDVAVLDGFTGMEEGELRALYDSLSLAMTFADFLHIRNYFTGEEHRDPSITEIRVLDTYWSDHCRHTTFSTEIRSVEFEEGFYRRRMEEAFQKYLRDLHSLKNLPEEEYGCLMDMAVLAAKKCAKEGLLDDQEESDEINACSIVVPIEVDGRQEEWLLNFKNETHNHPTEIEPFGGAATCLGGAIRDPLSGRTYVYQAMRITGAADPRRPSSETIEGKLPQKKIVREAALGYSSYGNQIGLATGYVHEIYHPGYVAKRMEIGAVVAAAPRDAVRREKPVAGDVILLLGGRTGRDGIGGATGSSKAHDTQSTTECGAEVQKGNPPTERKLQRLFRRREVSLLIKKCNDFGAGGVSVAIGELADGLVVDLDAVPRKYMGLDGTELAISESQERMAVVVAPCDVERFMEYADEENLEVTRVAVVTEEPRLILNWRGKPIVNLSRAFLDTNGARQETRVVVESPEGEKLFAGYWNEEVQKALADYNLKGAMKAVLSDLNVASQKGLVEQFDSSIGAASVLMPHGGRYQLTPTQVMAAKLPVGNAGSHAASLMSYGFDPYLSEKSPFHGAIYAITESIAKIVAAGGDHRRIRFSFQEYFKRMTEDPRRWGAPFAALLGAYDAQIGFGLGAIGGKDSMSGSFNDIDVPPTLVSFAVDMARDDQVVTPELKQEGNTLLLVQLKHDSYDGVDYEAAGRVFDLVHRLTGDGRVCSAYVVDGYGVFAAVAKMAFGNRLGAALATDAVDYFAPMHGAFVLETAPSQMEAILEEAGAQGIRELVTEIGRVTHEPGLSIGEAAYDLKEAIQDWEAPLEEIFPSRESEADELEQPLVGVSPKTAQRVHYNKAPIARPLVFIPVFPGTNCEYDSAKRFEMAGADTYTLVFKNRTESDIRDSVEAFSKAIRQAQIVMFPGGFSAGDEPEGSAKFFATVFRNEKIREEMRRLLEERDGLALGICNGFQALIKLGLVPFGQIRTQTEDSPTLTTNTIGRHVSKVVYTEVVSNRSPWLSLVEAGSRFAIPASHGEGRFVAGEDWIRRLYEDGQVATVYVAPDGSTDDANPNGSFACIEGITSPDGRVFGKMCHSERIGENVMKNIYGEKDMKLFEAGVAYFQ